MYRRNKRGGLSGTGGILCGIFFLLFSGAMLISAEEPGQSEIGSEENRKCAGQEPEGSEKEEGQIQVSQIQCPEPDGQNGWYVTAPEIQIVHGKPGTVTEYRLSGVSGKVLLEGELKLEAEGEEEQTDGDTGEKPEEEPEQSVVSDSRQDAEVSAAVKDIPPEIFEEGKNLLEVWMISMEDGKELFRVEKEILLDLSPPGAPEIQIPVYPDGNGTFFHSQIQVNVRCMDDISGVEAIYVALDGKGEQRIAGSQGSITVFPGYEGKISAYAVDCAGRKSRKEVSEAVFCEDEAPGIKASAAGGFGIWQQGSVEVEIYVEEKTDTYGFSSGLRSVTCYTGTEIAAERKWEYGGRAVLSETLRFTVDQSSSGGKEVPLTVHVSDRAGNTAVLTEKLYIDVQNPSVEITGVRDRMIAGKEKSAVFTLCDENILADCGLSVSRTGIDGRTYKIQETSGESWKGSEQKKQMEMIFSEDGKYVCRIYARDASGRRTEKTVTFTIDRTDPVIRYVEQLDGTHIPYFRWNYGKDMIRDLTENTCSMFLNGRRYLPGTEITEEGIQLFEIRARDQAGNESSAEAVFTIDHTAPDICWGDIKDGKTYTEGALLSVWVEGEGERIRALYINGEKQRLNYESRIFQYEITRYGNYTVRVQAEDLAGNCSEESISFQVKEERKGIAAFFAPDRETSDGYLDGDRKEGAGIRTAVPVLAIIGVICLCMGILRRRFRGKERE